MTALICPARSGAGKHAGRPDREDDPGRHGRGPRPELHQNPGREGNEGTGRGGRSRAAQRAVPHPHGSRAVQQRDRKSVV